MFKVICEDEGKTLINLQDKELYVKVKQEISEGLCIL